MKISTSELKFDQKLSTGYLMAAMASLTQKEHLSKWVIRASENETELMVNKANVRKYRILYILLLSFEFGG